MTDNEIKSALICCDFPTDELCCKCCFKGEENCTGKLTQATIDLINRQQKSKEYYKKNRDEYQDKAMFIAKQCDELQEEINRQQADKKSLEERNVILKGMVDRQQEEIERLQSILVRFLNEMSEWGDKNNIDTTNFSIIPIVESEKKSLVNQLKTGAVKEFAERLKNLIRFSNQPDRYYIDNLVKEMVGE